MSLHDYANPLRRLDQFAAYHRARFWRGFGAGSFWTLVAVAFFALYFYVGGGQS